MPHTPSPRRRRALLAALGALGAAPLAAQSSSLAGTSWAVTAINNGRGGVASLVAGTTVTVVVDGAGVVTGTAGCNRYRGRLEQRGDTVAVAPVAMTRMLCASPAGVMPQERAFATALRAAARVEVRGDRLTVRDAAGATQFTATRTGAGPAPAGTTEPRPGPAPAGAGMGGEFTYYADAARFTDCRTGRAWPVAMEGAYRDVERDYLAADRQGRPLYVVIDGDLAQRPRMEGEGTEGTIVVARYVGAFPALACARARGTASLVHTYWRLVRLDGRPVPRPDRGGREAHLILRDRGGRLEASATAGCNTMGGTAVREGDRLAFGAMRSTMMACGDPLDAREQALAAALRRTRSARVVAETLELRDETGATVALFESVYLL